MLRAVLSRAMPESSERIDRLRSIPLFSDLDDAALQRILDDATEFEAERGHILIQPNQAGSGLFVIEEGTVVVEMADRSIELGPGEFVGELALLDDSIRHVARVHAGTAIRCLAIRRDDFNDLLESEPKMAVMMLRVLARRLAGMSRVHAVAGTDRE
jgi:CRP-like cAMP-binding protein